MANQKTLFRRGVLQILEAERSCSIDDLVARIGERSGNLSSAINVLTSGPFVLSVGRMLYALRPVLDACRPLLPASFTAEDLLLLPPVQEFAQLVARGAGLPPLALAGTVAKRIASTGVATPIGPTTYCRTDVFKQLPEQIAGLFVGFTVRSLDEVSLAVGVDRSVTTHVVHGIMRDGRLMPLADDQYCSADCAKNVIACFRRARTYAFAELQERCGAEASVLRLVLAATVGAGRLVEVGEDEYCSVRFHRVRPCIECGRRTERREPITDTPLCRSCSYNDAYRYVTKTTAIRTYRLKPPDLRRVRSFERPNPHYRTAAPMQLFLKRQIEELLQDKLRAQPPSTAIQIWLDDNDQLRVRELSVLADVYQKDDAGRAVNQRALLTHVQDRLSVFTEDDIAELMDLMDNRRAREADFQRFFVAHSRLVAAAFNLQDVHPHVFLDNRDRDLIPDFILTDPVLQRAAVVELKLPRQLLIRRQANRDRFASAVMEARAQLLRYREWFRDENNRKALRAKVGMEIYEPKMGVIIGRNAAFLGDVDRQHLSTNTPDVEIVTFDDLVNLAKRRKWIIESS